MTLKDPEALPDGSAILGDLVVVPSDSAVRFLLLILATSLPPLRPLMVPRKPLLLLVVPLSRQRRNLLMLPWFPLQLPVVLPHRRRGDLQDRFDGPDNMFLFRP